MSMKNPLLARLSQDELLVDPNRKDWFESCLHELLSSPKAAEFMSSMTEMAGANDDNFWPAPDDWRAQYRPYIVKQGILQIPIFGVLLNRFSYQFGSYATGYTYILRCFLRGMEDPEVKGIALICESPGGVVAGNFEMVDKMFSMRGTKPIWAFAAEYAYSAAYSIASVADRIEITRTGGVGSIGVVTAHVDYSDAMAQAGIKVTFIYAGKHKVEGNAYEKLPQAAKDRIQARIDKLYAIFTSTVARNRAMDEEEVRATEALTYTGEDAVEVGLADKVGIFEESLAAFVSSFDDQEDEDENMATFTQEQRDKDVADARAAALAEAQASSATALAAAKKEGETAASARITAILGSEEGKKRPKAAMSLATKPSMSGVPAEDIIATLADLPEEQASTPKPPEKKDDKAAGGHFDAAMAKDNPNVGAGDQASGEQDDPNAPNPLVAALGAATGIKPRKAA